MRKLTALALASTLVFGSTSLAFAADTAAAPAATEKAAPTAPADTHATHMATEKSAPASDKMMHHKGGMMRHEGMFSDLNLTKEQKEKIRALVKEGRDQHPRGEDMKKHMEAMHKLVASDTFDESQAKTQINEMNKSMSDRALDRIRLENKMYNVLTPEQKKQFNANYQKRMDNWGKKMGKHGGEMMDEE